MPAWQARRVAQQTHRLPLLGARWVDERLASRTDGALGPVITDRLVALAIAKFDPEEHEQREADATAASDVKISHPDPTCTSGASDLAATGDTLILQAFYDLVCAIAHQLWLDGDTDPLGVRKIKAIGLITALATGQAALDLQSVLGTAVTKASGKVKVYVRVDAEDLDVDAHGGSAFATGEVERLGAATMAKLREWVGHHQVEILPVLNMATPRRRRPTRPTPVDAGARPAPRRPLRLSPLHRRRPPMRPRPRDPLRPRRPTRSDPPRRTRLPLPRHHRAKTARVWRYSRTPEGHYLWHGPHGATYLVTATGTHRL